MANAIEVKNLCKDYEKFSLKNVSFTVPQGSIMGFIGKNGSGKTSTIKSMLNIVNRTSGEVFINGMPLDKNEKEIKQEIGLSIGTNFYPATKVRTLTKVFSRAYSHWDEEKYRNLIERFEIDESKKMSELSEGMKVKYILAVAMSHDAKLLILDEPTSGLDPVSRDETVSLFNDFVQDKKHSILFSTHITSDLEKCASHITYISNGEILTTSTIEDFTDKWCMVEGEESALTATIKLRLIGLRTHNGSFEALTEKDSVQEILADGKGDGNSNAIKVRKATIEEIFVHLERRI